MDVHVITGNIAETEVDVIVNSTSSTFDLTAGPVTRAILEAGGSSFQVECSNEFPDGIADATIAVTDAHNLPCTKVYHVSLPKWHEENNDADVDDEDDEDVDDEDDEDVADENLEVEQNLKTKITECLESADLEYNTIAFPALGTGTLKYPADIVARCFYEAISELFDNIAPNNLQAVFLVLNPDRSDVIQAFRDEAINFDRIYFSDDEEINWSISSCDDEGQTTSFCEGDITQQTVDVIVNSTTPSLNLSSGPLTKAILKAGGDSLQDECKTNFPNGITESTIAITSGGSLKCRHVYHTTSCKWNNGPEAEQKLRDLIQTVLQEAENAGLNSIAIPALGTGVLNYPPSVVARCMYETAANFTTTSLKNIIFVVQSRDKKVVDAYRKEEMKHSSASGSFRVTYVKGDISQQDAEVIVNSTVPALNLSSGPVTKAILKAGGDNLQVECQTKYPNGINRGEIAVTSGGNMPCHNVYHITLCEWSTDASVKQAFCDLIIKCMTTASAAGKKSIAFPVLGTGTLKYPREIVAKCVFECFDQFSNANAGSSLLEARIVIHPKDVENIKIFEDINTAKDAPGQSAIFSDMLETFSQQTAMEVISHINIVPRYWSPMTEKDFVTKIQLSTSDREYKMVAKTFYNRVPNTTSIIKVERIQNKTLHIQYMMHKHMISTKNPGVTIERHLWHGTSYDAISSINVHGFNRSYSGKNAVVYGEGTYFAVCSSYSAQDTYSPPHPNGNKHMYLAGVLTGHYTVGDSTMKVPPLRTENTPYNTLVDDVNNPSIFVVFHDVQACPRYLVTFK